MKSIVFYFFFFWYLWNYFKRVKKGRWVSEDYEWNIFFGFGEISLVFVRL